MRGAGAGARGTRRVCRTVSVYACCPLHSQEGLSLDDKLYRFLMFRPMKGLGLILNKMGGLSEGSEQRNF